MRNDLWAPIRLGPWPQYRNLIFSTTGAYTLTLAGPNKTPDAGEGSKLTLNGSEDDDDYYARKVAMPWTDPDAALRDATRNMIFYQVTVPGNGLRLVKSPDSVTLSW